jgi:hypothetical protein
MLLIFSKVMESRHLIKAYNIEVQEGNNTMTTWSSGWQYHKGSISYVNQGIFHWCFCFVNCKTYFNPLSNRMDLFWTLCIISLYLQWIWTLTALSGEKHGIWSLPFFLTCVTTTLSFFASFFHSTHFLSIFALCSSAENKQVVWRLLPNWLFVRCR